MESNSNRSVSSSERSTLYSWQSLPSYEDVGWEVFQLDKDYWLGAGEGDQGTNRWQHIHNSIYFISYIEVIGFAGWNLKLAEQGYILAFFLLADESAMLQREKRKGLVSAREGALPPRAFLALCSTTRDVALIFFLSKLRWCLSVYPSRMTPSSRSPRVRMDTRISTLVL